MTQATGDHAGSFAANSVGFAVQVERERIASWHERKHREYYLKAADKEKYSMENRYQFSACSAWHLESALAIRDGTYAEDMAR